MNTWVDEIVTHGRILARSAALGLVLEKWHRVGLWLLNRSDSDYPVMLKKKLKHFSPPIIFGSGDKKLINQSGIAVVASGRLTQREILFSSDLGINVLRKKDSSLSAKAALN